MSATMPITIHVTGFASSAAVKLHTEPMSGVNAPFAKETSLEHFEARYRLCDNQSAADNGDRRASLLRGSHPASTTSMMIE